MSRASDEMQRLSGPERGEIYVTKFRSYLENLKSAAQCVPLTTDGQPMITAISEASGIPRNCFYTNKGIRRLLNEHMGLASANPSDGGGAIAHYQEQLGARDRRILQLEQRLAASLADSHELRRRLADLEQQLARYQIIEDEVLKAGRRVIP